MSKTATCLIEKNPLLREGLKSLLVRADFTPLTELSVIEELEDRDCYRLAIISAECSPDMIPNTIKTVREKNRDSSVVILSERADRESITASFSGGADGFLLKDMPAEIFIASLTLVMAGGKVFPSSMVSVITSGWEDEELQAGDSPAGRTRFSTRENEIVRHLAEGQSNKLIANELEITEATVKVHVKTILRKLKFTNRTQVAIWAVKNGALPALQSRG